MNDTPDESPADNGAQVFNTGEPSMPDIPVKANARKAARDDRKQTIGHMIWMALALIAPALVLFLTSHDEVGTAIFHSLRLGATSFLVALAIIGLSQIDKKFLGTKLDFKSRILSSMLGVMLWLVWVGSGQMVFKAADEAKAGALVEQSPSE